jgi:acetyl CoA:N6-hydroxylysine acetyl transferase
MNEFAVSETSQLTGHDTESVMTETERPKQYLQPGLTARVAHPTRPTKPTGWVYERFDNEHQLEIKFRVIDPSADLDLFHRWQNDPRVATFWEMAQPKPALAEYLEQQQDDRHTLGLIGHLNGQAFGYFEAYWCAEDRLGAYYDYHDFDRGWHGLTGSRKHLGYANTMTWLKGLCHYLFLDEPNTQRLMGEPRADNTLLLRLTRYVPYQKLGEFDFPHKRSALMQLTRDDFFKQVSL